MTDQEKIEALSEALNNLYQSADRYVEDGSGFDDITLDIDRAQAVLRQIPPKSWNLGG